MGQKRGTRNKRLHLQMVFGIHCDRVHFDMIKAVLKSYLTSAPKESKIAIVSMDGLKHCFIKMAGYVQKNKGAAHFRLGVWDVRESELDAGNRACQSVAAQSTQAVVLFSTARRFSESRTRGRNRSSRLMSCLTSARALRLCSRTPTTAFWLPGSTRAGSLSRSMRWRASGRCA